MIAALVFSRDRAMQLDLLLRSLPALLEPVYVIYMPTSEKHLHAYQRCASEHREVEWFSERWQSKGLPELARDFLADTTLACFLTDDSVFYRQPRKPLKLRLSPSVLCHSFRLGLNTRWCYPHARSQQVPAGVNTKQVMGEIDWAWEGADGDFGYPGSVDGHVFRASHLRRALLTCREDANPNMIEEHLERWVCARLAAEYPLMTAEAESSLVGIPVNRVNQTHPNRCGDRHPFSEDDLCQRYIAGERIALDQLDTSDVRGAHQEIQFVFESRPREHTVV